MEAIETACIYFIVHQHNFKEHEKLALYPTSAMYIYTYINHCFLGLKLSLLTPSLRQASPSNPHPTFTCCMQNNIMTMLFSLSSFHQKSTCIPLSPKRDTRMLVLNLDSAFSIRRSYRDQNLKQGLFSLLAITNSEQLIFSCF